MMNFELNNIHKYGSPKTDKLDYSRCSLERRIFAKDLVVYFESSLEICASHYCFSLRTDGYFELQIMLVYASLECKAM